MLTTHCPNACEWCFARPKMEEYRARKVHEINWEDFLAIADFYERSNLYQMILLGGEPGLHSRFLGLLHLLREKKFSVLVGTTGILPESVADRIVEEGFQQLHFALNSTSYFDYGQDKRKRVDHFLSRLGRRVALSYTITERDLAGVKIEPILDRIAMMIRFDLSRHLQFQIAVPGERNRLFVPFNRYGDLAELIGRWFAILRKNHIHRGLDCPCMPDCAIPDDLRKEGIFSAKCERFMIDIGPEGDIWPCFPLSQQSFKLAHFAVMGDLYRAFNRINSTDGILYDDQCQGCEEKEAGSRRGGCRGFMHVRRRLSAKEMNAAPGTAKKLYSNVPSFQLSFRRTAPCV